MRFPVSQKRLFSEHIQGRSPVSQKFSNRAISKVFTVSQKIRAYFLTNRENSKNTRKFGISELLPSCWLAVYIKPPLGGLYNPTAGAEMLTETMQYFLLYLFKFRKGSR